MTNLEEKVRKLTEKMTRYVHDTNPFEYTFEEMLSMAFDTYFELLNGEHLDEHIEYFKNEIIECEDEYFVKIALNILSELYELK